MPTRGAETRRLLAKHRFKCFVGARDPIRLFLCRHFTKKFTIPALNEKFVAICCDFAG